MAYLLWKQAETVFFGMRIEWGQGGGWQGAMVMATEESRPHRFIAANMFTDALIDA